MGAKDKMAKMKLGATGLHLQLQLKMPTDVVSVTCAEDAEEWDGQEGSPWESSLPARLYFLALPWAATASMALRTVSSSPRNCMGLMGFRFLSSS